MMKKPTWSEFKRKVSEYEPHSFERFEGRNRQYLENHPRRFHRMLCVLIDRLKPEAEICDLGAFPGTFLKLILDYGKGLNLQTTAAGLLNTAEFRQAMQSLGIEVIKLNLDPVHDGLPVGTGNPEYNLSDRKGAFDVVVASEICEHMINPLHLLKVANDILKPGGYLLLTTPNLAWLKSRIIFLFGRSPNEPFADGLFKEDAFGRWRPHYRVYTRGELSQLLEHTGFSMVHGEFLQETAPGFNFVRKIIYARPAFRRTILLLGQKN